MTDFSITPVDGNELDDLLPLMRAYCDFYQVAPTDHDLRELVRGLLDANGREGLQLLGRDQAGTPAGFATVLFTWSTTSAARAAVMNDLHVSIDLRPPVVRHHELLNVVMVSSGT